jgi:hypothetical protein
LRPPTVSFASESVPHHEFRIKARFSNKAAAERGFFRALKELRQVEREAKAEIAAPAPRPAREALGSSLTVETLASILESLPGETARFVPPTPSEPSKRVAPARSPGDRGSFYLPIAIGRSG